MTRVRRDERGSSLIIALAFLALFSLFLATTLTASESGLHISHSQRVQPKRIYAADGAVERAIQILRYDPQKGVDVLGAPSCDTTATINGEPITVLCEAQDGSGVSDIEGDGPSLGIITLSIGAGIPAENGYVQTGNSIVRLDGGLYARTPIKFVNGTACNNTGDVNCQQLNICPKNAKTVTDAELDAASRVITSLSAGFVAADVGAPIGGAGIKLGTTIAAVTISPPATTATTATMSDEPTVTGTNREVTFREDYPILDSHCHPEDPRDTDLHGKVTALDTPLTTACDTTRIVSIELNCDPGQPELEGNDPNYEPDQTSGFADPTVPGCGNGRIVELTPGRYDTAEDLTRLNQLTTNCDKLIWFPPGTYYFNFPSGVWTFGAANLRNLSIVAGARTWEERVNTDRGVFLGSVQNGGTTVTTRSSIFADTDVGKFINSGSNLTYGTRIIDVIDSTHATINNPAASSVNSGLFTIGGSESLCDKASPPPPTVAGAPPNTRPGTQFIFGGASRINAIDGKAELCAPTARAFGTQEIPAGTVGKNSIALYGAKAGYLGLAAQSGCLTATPYPGSGCAMVTTGGPKVVFIVHGAFYTPGAPIDLSLQTVGYQVISRGIIAHVVALGISPSADNEEPLIYAPEFGAVIGADRQVLLTACGPTGPPASFTEANPCGTGGVARLRSMVRIKDVIPGSTVIDVGHSVTIESWTVLR